MSSSAGFDLLHPDVQKWIWDQGWEDGLHEVQENSVKPILGHDKDVLNKCRNRIWGKLRQLSCLLAPTSSKRTNQAIRILYISPLKALINDQYRRLESLCEKIDVPLTPWHGDVSQSLKVTTQR